MNDMSNINRRSFLVGSATAGLAVGFHIPFGTEASAQLAGPEVNAWVVVKPDDSVVIRVARSEMGQGTLTGLCQLVAEELECDWSKVSYEFPTPGENLARKRVWSDFFTAGSRGIRASHETVRKGGAAARMMLIQAAANEWKVPASECSAANGVITHKASGRSTTFGKVASAASRIEPPADVKLKDPKDWKIAGKGVKRLDTAVKVNGEAIYGIDIKRPGMVNAAIKACPVFGGTLKSFDAAKVASMRGVKKVVAVDGNAVAVIADTWWNAKTALEALPIVWDEGPNAKVSSATIADVLKAGLDADQAIVGNQGGDIKAALAGAAKKVEAVYAYPYQHHVTLEPMNATALYTPEKCEVWASVQDGEQALAATAEAAGIPVTKCEFYKTFLGGGFGRRSTSLDYVRQAVLVAKEMPGTPVKLLWSREEDMTHGWYHPDHPVQDDRRVRRQEEPHRAAHPHFRPVDPGDGGAGPDAERRGPRDLRRLLQGRTGGSIRLRRAEPPDRSRHAQSARAAGVLAGREHQPQRHLYRELHGRARQGDGRRSARVPPQADGQIPASISPCSMRWRKRPAGASRRRRASIAASPSTWASAAISRPAPRSRSTATR